MENTSSLKSYLKKLNLKSFTMIFLLIVFVIVLSFLTGGLFINTRNISMLARQMAVTGMLAIGMSLIIIHGNIDLSIGSVMLVCATIAGQLNVISKVHTIPTILIVVALGIAIGAWNGFWVAYRGLPAFIATMATQLIFKGISLSLSNGKMLGPFDSMYQVIGQGYINRTVGLILGIIGVAAAVYIILNNVRSRKKFNLDLEPMIVTMLKIVIATVLILGTVLLLNAYQGIASPVLIMVILAIIFTFITKKTRFGRNLYAIGSNAEAARFSGINIKLEAFKAYLIMGALAAIGGIVLTSRLNMATSTIGDMAEMDAISACVIGGVSMAGGIGSVPGALIGTLLISVLDNGMSLLNVDSFWQYVVKGLVLTAVVWYDISSNKKQG